MMGRSFQNNGRRKAFTLVELLVSISVITLLASLIIVSLAGVQENAKRDRTRSQIARIDALISDKWQSFHTRRLPTSLVYAAAANPQQQIRRQLILAELRVRAIRDMMRLELPERKTDLMFPSVLTGERPAVQRAYLRKAAKMLAKHRGETYPSDYDAMAQWLDQPAGNPRWSPQNQTAECLYLILSQMTADDKNALQFFDDREIADVDNDGMPEIVDGWGQPIRFLRWAPGYELAGGPQDHSIPDPFDPQQIYGRWPNGNVLTAPQVGNTNATFALYPLIFSAGSNRATDIYMEDHLSGPIVYATMAVPNNPYRGWLPQPASTDVVMVGELFLRGKNRSLDDITNHGLIANP